MNNKLHYDPRKLPTKPQLPVVDALSDDSFDCMEIFTHFEFIGKGTNPSLETVYKTKLCGIALKDEDSWENYQNMVHSIKRELRIYEDYMRQPIRHTEPFYNLVGEYPNFYYFLPKYSQTLSIIAPLDSSLVFTSEEINFLSSLRITDNTDNIDPLTNPSITEIITKIRKYTNSINNSRSILQKLVKDYNPNPPRIEQIELIELIDI